MEKKPLKPLSEGNIKGGIKKGDDTTSRNKPINPPPPPKPIKKNK
jgi:hypothetical protein